MGAQDIQGYTRYTVLPGQTWVNKIYRGIQGIQYYQGKHGYTRYIGVYRVYSTNKVNMGKQDIQGIQYYQGKHACTGYIGVYRVYSITSEGKHG